MRAFLPISYALHHFFAAATATCRCRYWEDASDAYRDALGTCLPLWRFEDTRSRKKHVTGVAWNPHYHDMFAGEPPPLGPLDVMVAHASLMARWIVVLGCTRSSCHARTLHHPWLS